MQVFKAIPFIDWYKRQNAGSIIFSTEDRFLEVFDRMNSSKIRLNFSKKIDSDFDLLDLFKDEFGDGDFQYFVFPSEPFLEEVVWRIQVKSENRGRISENSFSNWYKESKSLSVKLDFENRQLVTFSKIGIKKALYFSESIDSPFDLTDLIKSESSNGDYFYEIYFNGFQGKDYLWRRKISLTL